MALSDVQLQMDVAEVLGVAPARVAVHHWPSGWHGLSLGNELTFSERPYEEGDAMKAAMHLMRGIDG